ncbi:MAG: hypothetical protein HY052_01045 [Proteobacteria bacterium]|nr:hypothetical protein [Pseudomonadota bacterium]
MVTSYGFPTHIVICQDHASLNHKSQSVAQKLRARGYDVTITCVENDCELHTYLEQRRKNGDPAPNGVFLDVGGMGKETALRVIKWYDEHYPRERLPVINFMSLSIDLGITEAGRVRNSDDRVAANFIDPAELDWMNHYLDDENYGNPPPVSAAFRAFLNSRLGTRLPLDHDEKDYALPIKKMNNITHDRVLDAWQQGKLTDAQTVGYMRNYSLGLARALRSGFYAQENTIDDLQPEARFYGCAGFPIKGPAVFSREEVENFYSPSGEKPILMMRGYDPAVVPLLANGKLGGLVVTSPYMASHLKLLCETHMVSGLFGLMPPGKPSLTRDFNEEAKPNLPPYFDGDTIEIAGQMVKRGQEVLAALAGDSLALNPPDSLHMKPASVTSIRNDAKLKIDIRNLKKINACFAHYFAEQGRAAHGVKANIDSADADILDSIEGIGLVRTEQMVAIDQAQITALKKILLHGDPDDRAYRDLFDDAVYNYGDIIRKLHDAQPVKIRLFDFTHQEILNKEEQKQFLTLHNKLDIHGGEALAAWPRLYQKQIETIFLALRRENVSSGTLLEIMMPAIRTEKEVLDIKHMIDEEACKQGIQPSEYSFGIMAETIEACNNIGQIARHCDFISFGTNDLTQQVLDLPRSDLKAHARFTAKNGYDPFQKIAPQVFDLMKTVVAEGRAANPHLKIDVCGAQAADPDTALSLYDIGVDNISVAPNMSNLYGLPVLLNYRAYEALLRTKATADAKPSKQGGP